MISLRFEELEALRASASHCHRDGFTVVHMARAYREVTIHFAEHLLPGNAKDGFGDWVPVVIDIKVDTNDHEVHKFLRDHNRPETVTIEGTDSRVVLETEWNESVEPIGDIESGSVEYQLVVVDVIMAEKTEFANHRPNKKSKKAIGYKKSQAKKIDKKKPEEKDMAQIMIDVAFVEGAEAHIMEQGTALAGTVVGTNITYTTPVKGNESDCSVEIVHTVWAVNENGM